MCSLLLLLLLLLQNSNSSFLSASVHIIVRSGEAVQLSADLTAVERERLHDLWWQHPNGQLILKNNESRGDGGRWEVLADGSLSFSRTETRDSGKYSMLAFDKDGTRIKTKEIHLQVKSESSSSGGIIAAVSSTICCVLLLGVTVSSYIIVKRRRRRRRRRRSTQRRSPAEQEHVYMAMSPSNRKEEDNYCALLTYAVPTKSPIPQLDSPDVDGIYV